MGPLGPLPRKVMILPGCVAQSVMCLATDTSDCRSRGRELDPGPVPYFGGDGFMK